MKTILVIDDEKSIRDSIQMILEYEKFRPLFAENGEKGIKLFLDEQPDAVLLDIKMPGKDGIEVLSALKRHRASIPVIMISGHGTFDDAVKATKLGAFDYLAKPLDRDKLLITLRNALEQRQLSEEILKIREKETILGESQKIKDILALIERVGPTEARVLITGESGTGKELAAKALHRTSKRSAMPMVEVNCAAIPSELIESELFGHEKGSFTGATAQRIGKFEQADEGTLFLDEIGDMSLQAQAKVLRALEEGKIERVGGTKTINVNVRVIAATNKNLPEEIKKERFREDLYHRLNVIPITIPPLRERREDIPILAKAFVQEICERNGMSLRTLSHGVLESLRRLDWTGNIRELRNTIERLVIMSSGTSIDAVDFEVFSNDKRNLTDDIITSSQTFQDFKDRAELAFIKHQLELHGWNISKTAETLQMERSHLYTKLKKYGLERERGAESPEQ